MPSAKRLTPAAKSAQRASSPAPSAAKAKGPGVPYTKRKGLNSEQPEAPVNLRPTDVEGVFLNERGIRVNVQGIALSFAQMKTLDAERWERVIGGPVDSPAKLLKAAALDPLQPLCVRIDAAKSAAPYFDRKQPQAIDGGVNPDGTVIPLFDASKLSDDELQAALALLRKGGAGV